MPNDAKLGLVLGVTLVMLIAVVFFKKATANTPDQAPAAAAVNSARPHGKTAAQLPAHDIPNAFSRISSPSAAQ
jgi:hypothetical protein